MIALLETLSEGPEHSPVNGALLEIVGLAYPEERLAFFGSAEHLAEVKTMLGAALVARTEWHAVRLAPRHSTFMQRVWRDGRLLALAGAEAARDPRDGLVLSLQGNRPLLIAAAIGRRLGLIRAPVQAILHGYLNEAVGWRSRDPLKRMIDMRGALAAAAGNVTLVTLEAGIRSAMRVAMPGVGERMALLRHPLPVIDASFEAIRFAPGIPLRIGFLGLATRAKGFDAFVSAARRLKPRFGGLIEFHAIGRAPVGDVVELAAADDVLATRPTDRSIPRAEYDSAVARMHYVCSPFDARYYTLSPSGSLLDALAHAKPIIASSTPVTRELFDEADPGVLIDRPDDLADAIARLMSDLTASIYDAQVAAVRRARARREPRRLADDYAGFTRLGTHRRQ